jgi:hypothetical protein
MKTGANGRKPTKAIEGRKSLARNTLSENATVLCSFPKAAAATPCLPAKLEIPTAGLLDAHRLQCLDKLG